MVTNESHEILTPVMDGVFTPGPEPKLLGALCPACQRKFFPRPRPMLCPRCWGDLSAVELSTTGKLYAYSVVRTKPPFGLPTPYAVGYVDLEADGLRVFGLLDSDPLVIPRLAVGKEVSLQVGQVGTNSRGEPCLRYYFTPRDE